MQLKKKKKKAGTTVDILQQGKKNSQEAWRLHAQTITCKNREICSLSIFILSSQQFTWAQLLLLVWNVHINPWKRVITGKSACH